MRMENYKLDIYLKETGNIFAGIKNISVFKQSAIIKGLRKQAELNDENSNLFIALRELLAEIIFTAEETNDLKLIFDRLVFDTNEDIYLIWDDKNIDQINICTLIANWQYIWYGAGEDAVILYTSNSKKIIVVTHYGSVFHN